MNRQPQKRIFIWTLAMTLGLAGCGRLAGTAGRVGDRIFPAVFLVSAEAAPKRCGLLCKLKKRREEEERRRLAEQPRVEAPAPPAPPAPKPPPPGLNRPLPTAPVIAPKPPVERITPAPVGPGVYHVVKKRETLWRICHTYGVNLAEVARINGITDPTAIEVGQKIWIPGAKAVLEVPALPEPSTPRGEPPSPETPARPPPATPPTAPCAKLLFPVPGGRVTSHFGPRGGRMHEGTDICAPLGTDILAADDGKVVYADNGMRGYGNMIILKHAGNLFTVYAHNSRNLVKVGDLVKRGQKIAEVGQTGRASAPHCHFEVRIGEKPVDAEHYLP